MARKYSLSDYINKAMGYAVYVAHSDGTYCGTIPPCLGVIAFGNTMSDCEEELRSTLEDWILIGFQFNHPLPIIDDIDLNLKPKDQQRRKLRPKLAQHETV